MNWLTKPKKQPILGVPWNAEREMWAFAMSSPGFGGKWGVILTRPLLNQVAWALGRTLGSRQPHNLHILSNGEGPYWGTPFISLVF